MKVQVSASFKKHARKTILSIFVFAFTYIFLLLFAIGITIGFTFLGLLVFTSKPMFLTAIACIGLFASGLTVLFFLIKFIFASTKVDTDHLTEITEHDEPELFLLIHQIVSEVDTSFPKKIFLSHDVNASVFYDSSFWSMFLPIRKNLQIGVGLINAVTQQELKAILAHEFGHFSQKSMKVGSYVYHVNQIIYNMLYKNESLDNIFEKWGNVSGYSAIFIGISVFIIQQIQNILKYLYKYVNLNYLALSREMEFHADEIAAHVAGSKALADSLLRLGFANHALNYIFNFYDGKISENIRSNNIYHEQNCLMLLLAERSRYRVQEGFPQIELATLKKYDKSKLNLENQWASHPTDEERVKALWKLDIIKNNVSNEPAIALLSNGAAIADQISEKLFSHIQYQQVPATLNLSEFKDNFESQINRYTIDPKFNDFYDYNNPLLKGDLATAEELEELTFDELFADRKIESLYELNSLKSDKHIVEAIQKGDIKLKTFDYDGKKYRDIDADELLIKIENDILDITRQVDSYNYQIHHYFLRLSIAQERKEEFDQKYDDFEAFHKTFDESQMIYDDMNENTAFFFQTLPFGEIEARVSDLKRREVSFKKRLSKLLSLQENIQPPMDATLLSTLNKYINTDLLYFNVDEYKEENLQILLQAIAEYKRLLDDIYFSKKKTYLDFILRLEEDKTRQ